MAATCAVKPLSMRRRELEEAIGKASKELFSSTRLAENGIEAYRIAKRRGLEGAVAKDSSSPYEEKRSRYWLKVKVHQEEEFVIGGFTAPQGSRSIHRSAAARRIRAARISIL